MESILLAIIAIVVLAGALLWRSYNALVALSQGVEERGANVKAVARTRADLTNQLVGIAKEYGLHERVLQVSVAETESQAPGPASAPNMTGVFSQMARAYPELKANENYMMLMTQLENVEKELLSRRETYNEAVRAFNTARGRIPTVLIAARLGFSAAPYFTDDDMASLEVFRTDSGEVLKGMLGDVAKSIGETSRKLGSEIGTTGRRFARKQDAPEVSGGGDQ